MATILQLSTSVESHGEAAHYSTLNCACGDHFSSAVEEPLAGAGAAPPHVELIRRLDRQTGSTIDAFRFSPTVRASPVQSPINIGWSGHSQHDEHEKKLQHRFHRCDVRQEVPARQVLMRRLKKLKPRRWAMGNGTGQRGAPTPSLVMHSYARSPCDESPRGAGQP